MKIKIGYASHLSVDSEHIRNFYDTNWKRKIALTEKKFYDWQFIKTPNSGNMDHCVIAYDDEKSEILGVMGLNKRDFFINNKLVNGAELTTWIVSNKTTGLGLGAKILSFIQDKFEVLIGMGISEMALPIYMRSGFRYVLNIPRFIKVINFEQLKLYSKYTSLAGKLIKQWNIKKTTDFFAKEVTYDEYNNIFDSVKEKINLFSRDNAHRVWRYDNHPFFHYKQFIITRPSKGNSEKSFIAFREEKNLLEFKILHIMDLFGDESCLPSAINFIENYAIKNGFDAIDFYCTASSVYRFMLGEGWFSTNDDSCFQFPHLFHPIEMRNPPTTSLIYWSKNYFTDMADLSKLYISKQDADLDRPTLHAISFLVKD
jgi:hypothetical protein